MLMNSIKKSYWNMMGHSNPVQPIVVAPGIREAANASGYNQSEMRTRRQRRQRRMDSAGQHGSLGWRIRAW